VIQIAKEALPPPHEDCTCCSKPTPYWSVMKDVPVCPGCAKTFELNDIPTKQDWIRQSASRSG
jgi:hypothetical protein